MDSVLYALKDRLYRRKRQILATLHQLQCERKEAEDWIGHTTGETRQKQLDRLSAWYLSEAARIEKALGRIDTNIYGLCGACGHTIEKYRLVTFPESEFCAYCHPEDDPTELDSPAITITGMRF